MRRTAVLLTAALGLGAVDRRLAELARADREELRLVLTGAALVLLGLAPHLFPRLLE